MKPYLIVRSLEGLQKTLNRFKTRYDDIMGVSVMNIEFLSPPLPIINTHAHFIFTSAYAVQSLGRYFTPSPSHKAFCVGETTAEYAKHIGFKNIITPHQHQATALIEAILQENIAQQSQFIYVTGVHRKPHIEQTLMHHNFNLQTLIVYDAVAKQTLAPQAIDFLTHPALEVICFSARNAVILYDIITQNKFVMPPIWHSVGQKTDIDFANSTHLNICFYDTPQKLYDFFSI